MLLDIKQILNILKILRYLCAKLIQIKLRIIHRNFKWEKYSCLDIFMTESQYFNEYIFKYTYLLCVQT